jgi:hypothetical protein
VRIDLVGLEVGKQHTYSAYQPSNSKQWPISAATSGDTAIEPPTTDNPDYIASPVWATRRTHAVSGEPRAAFDEELIQEDDVIDYDDTLPFVPGMMITYGSSVGQFRSSVTKSGLRYLEIAFPRAGRTSRDGDLTVLLPESRWDSVAAAPDNARPGFQKAGFAPRPIDATAEVKPAEWESRIEIERLVRIAPMAQLDESQLLEAVACISDGAPSELAEVARIIRPDVGTPLAISLLISRLESEAKINVIRDESAAPIRWYAVNPSLAGISDKQIALFGTLSSTELSELNVLLAAAGWTTSDVHSSVRRWNSGSGKPFPTPVALRSKTLLQIHRDWLLHTSALLPRVSKTLSEAVPESDIAEVSHLERWLGPMSSGDEWQSIDRSELSPGDFVRGYFSSGRVHGLVISDVRLQRVQQDLGKLVAGARRGWNLVQYSDEYGLVLPGSIQLPGLYGRVVSMASSKGLRATRMVIMDQECWMSTYSGIDRGLGERLAALLNN